jgi:hypothetical protein
MGVDIHGWVEIRTMASQWDGVLKIDSLAERVYDMFGCLFGVMNFAHFCPIAADRGFPPDLSEEATRELVEWDDEWGSEPLWPTWIAWHEIQGIDWEEGSLAVDSRVHRYRKAADGCLIYDGKGCSWSDGPEAALKEGQTYETEEYIYKVERIRRQSALSPGWKLIFDLIARLAEAPGVQSLRLVVWFDR